MSTRRVFTLAGLSWVATGCGYRPCGFGVPRGLDATQSCLEASATREAALRIDAATGLLGIDDLLKETQRRYPAIQLEVRRPSSRELHLNFLRETAAGQPTADLLISPAMDLHFKLVNDGYALTYESPQKPYLPDWAVWKDQAYAVCADPLVFVYNKRLMPHEDIPTSHDALVDLLERKPDEYRGKIATYDPEESGTGYLYYTQDLLMSHDTLDLVRAVGRTLPRLYISGGPVRDMISAGKHVFGYNMVNSYMVVRPEQHPDVGIIFPSDYTLVVSRIAFIPKTARHPDAAKLVLDFLLSEPGQTLLARQQMMPVRNGISMQGPSPTSEVVRRIHFGPALLANLDEFRRRRVLREWRRALES